jgi:7-cyano-7-deazaguanine synthase
MKAVVLVSGGIDSLVTLATALQQKREVYPIAIDYGQKHSIELNFAALQVDHFRSKPANIHPLKTIHLSKVFDAPLAKRDNENSRIPVQPDHIERRHDGSDNTYVPNRNAVMLNMAASYAESVAAFEVWCGLIKGDPDNKVNVLVSDSTPKFVEAMNKLLEISCRDYAVRIKAPYINKMKWELVKAGVRLGVPLLNAWSCFNPPGPRETDGYDLGYIRGKQCGKCPACLDRIFAFMKAGVSPA